VRRKALLEIDVGEWRVLDQPVHLGEAHDLFRGGLHPDPG
jgi:hypothetical protein